MPDNRLWWSRTSLEVLVALLICQSVICHQILQQLDESALQNNYPNYGDEAGSWLGAMDREDDGSYAGSSADQQVEQHREKRLWRNWEDDETAQLRDRTEEQINEDRNKRMWKEGDAADLQDLGERSETSKDRYKRLWRNWEDKSERADRKKRLWKNWDERLQKRLWKNWDDRLQKRLWRNWEDDEETYGNGDHTALVNNDMVDPNHQMMKRILENSEEASMEKTKRLEEMPESIGNNPDNVVDTQTLLALKRFWKDMERGERMCLPCPERSYRDQSQHYFTISSEISIPCCK